MAVPLPSLGKASLIGIPLQREGARRPAAVLFQRQTPGHAADPGGKAADGAGGQRGNPEAKLRRARLGMAPETQEKAGDARLAGAQRAAAGGGKIKRGLSQLADRHSHATAGKRRLEGPQGLALRARGDLDDAGGIETEPDKARRIKKTRLAPGIRLADPKDRGHLAGFDQARDERQREAAGRPAVPALARRASRARPPGEARRRGERRERRGRAGDAPAVRAAPAPSQRWKTQNSRLSRSLPAERRPSILAIFRRRRQSSACAALFMAMAVSTDCCSLFVLECAAGRKESSHGGHASPALCALHPTARYAALLDHHLNCGGMPEWLNGAVSKTVVRASVPGVRIPLPPPASTPKPLEYI